MRNAVNIFKALSDETRLRILKLLEGGELCICKIMEVLDMRQSRISRHMGILKNAGLVVDRRDGKWVHYSLDPKSEVFCCKEVIVLLKKCLGDNGIVSSDRLELRKLVEKEKRGLWRPAGTCGAMKEGSQGRRVTRSKGQGSKGRKSGNRQDIR